jgi:carboxyl-terminal processing protease
MKRERGWALLFLGVLFVSAVLGGLYGPSVRATPANTADLENSIRSLTRVLSIVQQNYAVPVDTDHALYDGAIPGMLRVLDPHSTFFDPRQYAALREDQRGKYYGVGMTVAPQDNHTVVQAPMPDSPASKAGIRPGDVIHNVDGKPTDGLTTSEVSDLLRGPKGTTVHVSVIREGDVEPLVFSITRDEIPKHAVDVAFLVRPGVGYVHLSGFESSETGAEVEAALRQLDVANLEGLVFDLRGNPGGLVDQAISVADMFLDKNQLIVSHHGRASQERRYYAVRGNRGIRTPLVMLVNGDSASASEIVTGAIQDHDRGLVVGEQTFGKGLVQTVSSLSENTGLALTIARYYTPSGRLIQRDYKDVSLYDYKYNHKNPQPTEVKLTDGGRQVFGGGGITPDTMAMPATLNTFQQAVLRHNLFFPFRGGVGSFTTYFLGTKPTITKDFMADDRVVTMFRDRLDQEGITYTEADIVANLDWIKREIKKEVFITTFGLPAGYEIEVENDPQVITSIESLPKARTLYENVRAIMAQRAGG